MPLNVMIAVSDRPIMRVLMMSVSGLGGTSARFQTRCLVRYHVSLPCMNFQAICCTLRLSWLTFYVYGLECRCLVGGHFLFL